jgi:PTH1 family peptidyl-tRNA hydrolase
LRSIIEVLGSGDFVRVRIGVGRPPLGGDVAGYVLNPFGSTERASLDAVVTNSAAAVATLLARGVAQAMNEFNNRDIGN